MTLQPQGASDQAAGLDLTPIPLLERTRSRAQSWQEVAPRYGVTQPDPPWKTSLSATCECLAAGGAMTSLDRRQAEDQLVQTTYRDVPAPERQLLALAHTMSGHGLISEDALHARMEAVRARLEAA
jgi:hypothetical protein